MLLGPFSMTTSLVPSGLTEMEDAPSFKAVRRTVDSDI